MAEATVIRRCRPSSKALEALISFHTNRRLPYQTLTVQKSNDTPLHVCARALRMNDFQWMVEYGGFSAGLVMKNVYNQDTLKLIKEGKKLLKKMQGYAKKKLKASKSGKDPPPPPPAILFPPQYLPPPEGDPRERINAQPPGQTPPSLPLSRLFDKPGDWG